MSAPDGTGAKEIDALIDAYRDAVAKYWNQPIGDPPDSPSEPRTIPTAGEARAALIAAVRECVRERDALRREFRFLRGLCEERQSADNYIPGWLAVEWLDSADLAIAQAASQAADGGENG